MNPDRKRTIRLVAALSTAVVLAVGLIYVSFSASSEAREPSELATSAEPGASYDLTGDVVDESIKRTGSSSEMRFEIADRDDPSSSIPVVYSGQIPDPFREGREGDRHRRGPRRGLHGRSRQPDHEVPVEVPG